ncbi:MAG TPA: hypothetical protein VFB38_09335 [Chthonomonadaceae bacterium]|nr:hypothetical protein [Chthonomonadaceae bacterium]
MAEELGPVLREIADLLKQRVEHDRKVLEFQQEKERQQRELMAQAFGKVADLKSEASEAHSERPELAGIARMREEAEKYRQETRAQMEQERQERREFRMRRLAELERHNNMLERILERLTR